MQNAGADPFGSDPFNAPKSPGRVESPTPALPPKKSKQPPPRPAPPKAVPSGAKGPQRPAPPGPASSRSPQHDPFNAPGSGSSDPFGGSGFADFASFESKVNFVHFYNQLPLRILINRCCVSMSLIL